MLARDAREKPTVACARCGQPSHASVWDLPVCPACFNDWHGRESSTAGAVWKHLGIGPGELVGDRFGEFLREFKRRAQVWAHELRRGAA